jgi:hypothetical protein
MSYIEAQPVDRVHSRVGFDLGRRGGLILVSGVMIVAVVSDLRAVNAGLPRVVADKDELLAAQEALLVAQRAQLSDQGRMLRL